MCDLKPKIVDSLMVWRKSETKWITVKNVKPKVTLTPRAKLQISSKERAKPFNATFNKKCFHLSY